MPYMVIEVTEDSSGRLGEVFAKDVKIHEPEAGRLLYGKVIEIGTEYQGEE